MLKIGDFSKICQVSVKALRYWDEQGLLEPATTDPATGYRYYAIEQIAEVNQILAFRTLGLELKRIKQLLRASVTTSDIRAMLHLKQVELQQQLENTQAMLSMLEARLQQIECDGTLPEYSVSLKAVDPQTILAVRDVVPTLHDLIALLHETHRYARSRTGTNLLAVFHDPAYTEEFLDVQIGFPVSTESAQPIALSGERAMIPVQLPGMARVASTVHNGAWSTLSNGYVHLGRWIETNQYEIVGPGREIFHYIDWDDGHKRTVTELQFPVAPAGA